MLRICFFALSFTSCQKNCKSVGQNSYDSGEILTPEVEQSIAMQHYLV